MNIKTIDDQYVANTYKRFPVTIVSGKGSLVKDDEGKEYIDLGAGIAVTSFGLCDDQWQKAITEQAAKLQHMSNLYYTEPCARLAELLCKKTGMKKVFFNNSGAEANECVFKVMRAYAAKKKGPDCYTIVTLKDSFHGRTLACLSATGQDHYHEQFCPLVPGFESVSAGDMEALKKLEAEKGIAGILIECIQGEGGVIDLDPAFVSELAAFAAEKDIVLGCDEVQSGNGRTGQYFAYMNFGIQPDVVSTAKGLAGGLPLGATLMGEKVESVLGFGDHGSTFGGNPVCCAAALSIVSRMDEAFLQEVREKNAYLKAQFTHAPGIKAVSGMGLMLGLSTEGPAGAIVSACMERGVLCLTAKDKIRLVPALNIPMELLEKAAAIIKEECAKAAQS